MSRVVGWDGKGEDQCFDMIQYFKCFDVNKGTVCMFIKLQVSRLAGGQDWDS